MVYFNRVLLNSFAQLCGCCLIVGYPCPIHIPLLYIHWPCVILFTFCRSSDVSHTTVWFCASWFLADIATKCKASSNSTSAYTPNKQRSFRLYEPVRFCFLHSKHYVKKLKAHYLSTGKVRFPILTDIRFSLKSIQICWRDIDWSILVLF